MARASPADSHDARLDVAVFAQDGPAGAHDAACMCIAIAIATSNAMAMLMQLLLLFFCDCCFYVYAIAIALFYFCFCYFIYCCFLESVLTTSIPISTTATMTLAPAAIITRY